MKYKVIIIPMLLTIAARLIPHVANFVPVFAFYGWLLLRLPKLKAMALLFITIFISDIILSVLKGYSLSGSWILIVYVSYLSLLGIPKSLSEKYTYFLAGMGYPIIFWVVSNLLVWKFSMYYPHSFVGLMDCFLLALPFLLTSLVANSVLAIFMFARSHSKKFVESNR